MRRKWPTWHSHTTIPLTYYDCLGIVPTTIPRIIASDTICIHRSNYKGTCVTAKYGQDKMLHKQIPWWRPEATNPGSLPQWLFGRSTQLTTTIEIINHLYYSYGTITPIKIEDFANSRVTPYDPSNPITKLFVQI